MAEQPTENTESREGRGPHATMQQEPPPPAQEDGTNDTARIDSPEEFYRKVTARADLRELLKRLANL